MALAQTLNTGGDLKHFAELLRRHGSGKDKVLAHINPKEAALLAQKGGLKGRNPKTGLPEFGLFDDVGGFISNLFSGGGDVAAQGGQAAADVGQAAGGYDPSVGLDVGSNLPSAAQEISGAASGGLDSILQNLGIGAQQSPGVLSRLNDFFNNNSGLVKAGLAAGGLGIGLADQLAAQKQGAAAQQQIASIPQNLQAQSQQTQQQLQDISQKYQAMVSQAQNALQGMAAPLQEQFTQLVNLTNQGKLTPANQQIMDAARARIAQDAQSRGGVGASQAQSQLDRLQQNLLAAQMDQATKLFAAASPAQTAAIETGLTGANQANQYAISGLQQALSTTGIADQYALNAIQTGLQNDANARNSMQNFYSSLASVLAGNPIKVA